MGLLTDSRDSISRVVDRLSSRSGPKRIGMYGSPNAEKMTLANRIARDWTGDVVDLESHIPYETRRARRKENVEIERSGKKAAIDIVGIPGVTMKADYREFPEYDMEKDDAVRWSREATEDVAEAMHWLREDVDGVIYVLGSTKDPISQVSAMLIGITESQGLPMLIFANKIDLEDSSVERIANAYLQHEIVELSALEGESMDEVYAKIAKYFAWSIMSEATVSDNGSDGVQIGLFNGNRMANLASMERTRLILDDVRGGDIVILEGGLSPDEESKLVEATMAEISPDEFDDIEIETYPYSQTADQSFLDRLMGWQSTQELTVIDPVNQIRTLHEDENLISALVSWK